MSSSRRLTLCLLPGLLCLSCKEADADLAKPRAGSNPAVAASSNPSVPASSASAATPAATNAGIESDTRVDRVVLLTIDALRGDQPWTGYEPAKTPHLSKLAERAVVYTRTYSIANTTGPSISGMLAVRFPSELERDNCPLAGFTVGHGLGAVLEEDGVWTAAAHGHAYFEGTTAPKGGFTHWRTVENVAGKLATQGASTGPEVTELALELLDMAPKDRPSFIWAHYLEPHDKYAYHKDFPPSSTPLRGAYDGEVAAADHEVGKVIAAIDASAMRDRTALIVSADHGEAFGEHQRYRHGFTVFEEEVHVPLIVWIPGGKPRRIDAPRSTMDIPRTVAALLGVQPPERWRGTSLLRDLDTETPEQRPIIIDVPELMNLPAQQAVIMGHDKVIRFKSRWSVYDLEADPKEKKTLPLKANQELVDRAGAALDTIEFVAHRPCLRKAFRD